MSADTGFLSPERLAELRKHPDNLEHDAAGTVFENAPMPMRLGTVRDAYRDLLADHDALTGRLEAAERAIHPWPLDDLGELVAKYDELVREVNVLVPEVRKFEALARAVAEGKP